MKYLFFMFITLPFYSFGQYSIKGRVIDSIGVIPYANVIISDSSTSFFQGVITDENGKFILNIPKGEYHLKISYIGYKSYDTIINVHENLLLKDIILIEDMNLLNEITIVGKRKFIERKDDKLIFNVENSPVKNGFNGVEILKRAPGVFTDGKENILIQNKSATVLINGRKINLSGNELTNYLKNIDASRIKQIEIQTNATSEMDANIQGGVINYILKEKRTGLFTQLKIYQMQKGKHPNFYSSANINYGTKKWNIYSTFTFNKSEDSGIVKSDIDYNNKNRQLYENGNFLENSKRYTLTIGTTYQPVKKHELGFEIFATTKNQINKSGSEIAIFEDNIFLDKGITNTPRNRDANYVNSSINYSIKLDTLGGKVKFSGDYAIQDFKSDFDASTDYERAYYDNILERSKTNATTKIISAQMDFIKNIKKIGKLSAGIKLTSTGRNNKTIGEEFINGTYQTVENRTNSYEFSEYIYATYFSISKKLLKAINFKLGLRVENTVINGINILNNTPVNQNYLDFFPSLFLSKEFKNNQFISFSYNRKISRPAFNILNPYVYKINDFNYQIGNPNLKPQYINNFDLKYVIKQHSFSIFYTYTSNLIAGIYFPVNEAVYYQSQNIGNGEIIGLDYSFGKNIKKWWYLKVGITLQNQNYILADYENQHNSIFININNDWKISDTWTVNLSAYYSSPRIYSYLEVADYFKTDLMIQKSFLKNKLKIRIYVDDIFNTVRDKNTGFYDDFTYNFYQKRNTRAFLLYALFTIDTNNKIRKEKIKSSNNNANRL